MSIAVTGYRTTIVRELRRLVVDKVERIASIPDMSCDNCRFLIPPLATRFVLAAGVLTPKTINERCGTEIVESLNVNLVSTLRLCEQILASVPSARIVLIGSESGLFGSYDMFYAIAKSGLDRYVEWREVGPQQSLYLLHPPIIEDSGMTRAREDFPQVLSKRQHVSALQVATKVRQMLYEYQHGTGRERLYPC